MSVYCKNNLYTLYLGKMQEELDNLEDNSVDSIVTDPPYELNFMNKGWDNSGVAFQKDTWEKCLRVLKPGGHLLAFGGSRTYHRIACAIEDAGFEIRDTIMWIYGSGFPKSMDISKQIDKRGGASVGWFGDYLKGILEERGMTQADLSKHFPSKNGNQTGRVSNWINGVELPTNEQFNKVCELLKLPLTRLCEAEREVIGRRKSGLTSGSIANFSGENEFDVTAPSTDLAKQWEGWGTALKPAYEPIIVGRKPTDGTLVDNIIEYGVGGLNIDECRVHTEDKLVHGGVLRKNTGDDREGKALGMFQDGTENTFTQNPKGRFPANVVLDGSEEATSGFPVRETQNGSITKRYKMNNQVYGDYGYCNTWDAYKDSGSASRYYYCAKASKKDRDEGLDEFEEKRKAGYGYDLGYLNAGEGMFKERQTLKRNTHPTVKPTELMQYLVRLVSPKGATILDPFMGSGSTGKACMIENTERNADYKFIGIEMTEEYLPIADARIRYWVDREIEEEVKEDIKPTSKEDVVKLW